MRQIFILLIISISFTSIFSQGKPVKFTLEDVIKLARERSPDAYLAINHFRASYWRYKSYQANYLPSLALSGSAPAFNRGVESYRDKDGIHYNESQSLSPNGNLQINQNVGLTGSSISVNSNLLQNHQLLPIDTFSFVASPIISIGLSQPIVGYNAMKWERKIEPLFYDEAKKTYIEAVEQINLKAVSRFFDLAQAFINLRIAAMNFSNSDTLFKIAQGRYNIGTIAENDVLQMQLAYLNAKTELNRAEIDLQLQKARLRSFLGYTEKIDFELVSPDSIPPLTVEYDKVMTLAKENNPDVVAWQRRIIEAKRDVAQAKANSGFNANLNASYGLSGNAHDLKEVYQKPRDYQSASIGLQVPLLDWGRGRGRIKVAKSNQELTDIQIQQEQIDFEQNIFLQVMQFNLQNDMVVIAAKADTIGQKRYEVTKQRFLIGKIDVLNLNDALKEKDSAQRGYINALRQYWNYYYNLRQLTLYDFVKRQPLSEEFDNLVN
jgi:outer membrane protein TolC